MDASYGLGEVILKVFRSASAVCRPNLDCRPPRRSDFSIAEYEIRRWGSVGLPKVISF